MPSADTRIQKAMTARLVEQLSPDRVAALVGGTHTETLRDNVVPTVTDEQLELLRSQLAEGDGGELTARPKSGKTTAHAPYSSAALALNAFGGWLGHEQQLTVAGLGGWTEPLQIEAKLQIAHGGGRGSLDVLLRAPGRVLAVESKLKEYAKSHLPRHLRPVYAKPAMAELLPAGWRRVLAALLSGDLSCNYLDAEQLVKHALALQSQFPDDERTLAYIFLEPANADELPELAGHVDELEQLLKLLGEDADPGFVVRTYDDLFAEWEAVADPTIRAHVSAVRQRYGSVAA